MHETMCSLSRAPFPSCKIIFFRNPAMSAAPSNLHTGAVEHPWWIISMLPGPTTNFALRITMRWQIMQKVFLYSMPLSERIFFMKNNNSRLLLASTVLFSLVILSACNSTGNKEPGTGKQQSLSRRMPHISQGGEIITFDDDDSSRFILKTDTALIKTLTLTTQAPARIVVT